MKKVVIIGAGPCGLFTAFNLLKNKNITVALYDQKKSAGRKFLIAGKSGLNLTHEGDNLEFCKNYFDKKDIFFDWFKSFNHQNLIHWFHELGVETFVGTSGRVFPKNFKAAPLLKNWLENLKNNENFNFYPNHHFNSFNNNLVKVNDQLIDYDYCVFSLGGGSWSVTGSDGKWQDSFLKNEIRIKAFKALNCGFNIKWPKVFLSEDERLPIKYIRASFDRDCIKGDIMLTHWGVEGSPIYYLSHFLQECESSKKKYVSLDLMPDISEEKLKGIFKGKKSHSSKLKSLLDTSKIRLLKSVLSKEEYLDTETLIKSIKSLKLILDSARNLEEAISTSGGVCFSEVRNDLSLKKFPKVYVGGEMLDWNAPTGGYLLQGCFTQGYIISQSISENVAQGHSPLEV